MIYRSHLKIVSDPFVLPNGTKLNSLLYADDLIILSRSKTGLQNCLDALAPYCNTWMMSINPKKKKKQDNNFSKTCKKKCFEHKFIQKMKQVMLYKNILI